MSCANMAEPIKMCFGGVDSGGPKEPCIRWGLGTQIPAVEQAIMGEASSGPSSMSHSYSAGGSSDASFCCQYFSNLIYHVKQKLVFYWNELWRQKVLTAEHFSSQWNKLIKWVSQFCAITSPVSLVSRETNVIADIWLWDKLSHVRDWHCPAHKISLSYNATS